MTKTKLKWLNLGNNKTANIKVQLKFTWVRYGQCKILLKNDVENCRITLQSTTLSTIYRKF